jgi:hypothetical protein
VTAAGKEKTYREAYAEGTALKVLLTPAGGNPNDDNSDKEISLVPDPKLGNLPSGGRDTRIAKRI